MSADAADRATFTATVSEPMDLYLNPEAWPNECGDGCGNVFGASLKAFRPPIAPDANVLEVGCAEFDWLSRAKMAWPRMSFTGIDWRPSSGPILSVNRIRGDVLTSRFAVQSFDWVVGVSSIEHIGLGHYDHDPRDGMGDKHAMRKIAEWLLPGGWVYLDVPYNSGENAFETVGTSHRVYDDATVASRLVGSEFVERWRGVVSRDPGKFSWAQPPVPRLKGGERFYYLALWLQKA